jgi:hypothetical protein
MEKAGINVEKSRNVFGQHYWRSLKYLNAARLKGMAHIIPSFYTSSV